MVIGRAGTLGALLLAVFVGGGIGTVGVGSSADAQAAPTCVTAPGQVTVAVVIDDGRSAPTIDCLTVGPGTTGVQLMNIRAQRLGKPPLRFDLSGLLCAVDGYPAPPACGVPSSGGAYEYWSYWGVANGSWRYSTTGPASKIVRDGDVEGWHFITGTGTGMDNAPRVAASSITFGPMPVPTTARPATTRPGSTAPPTALPSAAPTTRPTAGSGPQPTIGPSPGAAIPPPGGSGGTAGGSGAPPVRVDGVTSTALGSEVSGSPADPGDPATVAGTTAEGTSGSGEGGSGDSATSNSATDQRSDSANVTVSGSGAGSGSDLTPWATIAGAGSLATAVAMAARFVAVRRRSDATDDHSVGPSD